MNFSITDFDGMRNWIKKLPSAPTIVRARLQTFDNMRYSEEYENLYRFITLLGGTIC